jgi:hypothetical protein
MTLKPFLQWLQSGRLDAEAERLFLARIGIALDPLCNGVPYVDCLSERVDADEIDFSSSLPFLGATRGSKFVTTSGGSKEPDCEGVGSCPILCPTEVLTAPSLPAFLVMLGRGDGIGASFAGGAESIFNIHRCLFWY